MTSLGARVLKYFTAHGQALAELHEILCRDREPTELQRLSCESRVLKCAWEKTVPDASQTNRQAMIDRLVRETGITETEARELVSLLGTDWSSLIREANQIRKGPRRDSP
jgi:hypothetical protein